MSPFEKMQANPTTRIALTPAADRLIRAHVPTDRQVSVSQVIARTASTAFAAHLRPRPTVVATDVTGYLARHRDENLAAPATKGVPAT